MNFFEELYPWPERVTAVGLHGGEAFRRRYPDVRYVQGDACALPFADGEFDLYFSNAVIEHVGGEERQRASSPRPCASRGRVFVTTPNRWFPLELHTRLPLVHWLPERAAAVPTTSRARAGRRRTLLGPGELRDLFPVPVRIVNLGMTLVAIT